MFYDLKPGQQVFIEITNPVHGGVGWEFGQCLWSPSKNTIGRDSWALMRNVNKDDLIIHLLKTKNKGYAFSGVSIANTEYSTVNSEPPQPDKWRDSVPYYRIELSNFMLFSMPLNISEFFNKYENELKNIKGSFYVEYGAIKELRTAEKYIAKVPNELFNIINLFLYENGLEYKIYSEKTDFTDNEPAPCDISFPNKETVTTTRFIRDTAISKQLKAQYEYQCQICGKSILLPNKNYYSEGHHLRPLGAGYQGPDIKENIIVVCPYHHAEFDYGSIAINPTSHLIEHINDKDDYNKRPLFYDRKDISQEFIEFHYKYIFGKK
ncbi:MAG: hypothetical protein CVU91_02350 [Firmicutes bacterium HGW-Firmicutes-16]|nr:MAG: hypothetical protein CVU91_02350 [Firmicutes bacterium HGW-Firmicutes-16]